MAFDDLRSFLQALDDQGQLLKISEEVNAEPDLAAAANATGRIGDGAPALWFDNIRGFTDARVAMNTIGSWQNHAISLGLPPNTPVKNQIDEFIRRWDKFPVTPERRANPAWAENTVDGEAINLFDILPLFRLNDGDGGFYLDKACVVSRDPLDPDNFGKQNVGIYRMEVKGKRKLGLQPVPMHDIALHLHKAEERGEDLPIAITLGNDPIITLMGATPLKYDQSEYEMAGALRESPYPIATAPLTGFDVPWGSEVILEGVIYSGVFPAVSEEDVLLLSPEPLDFVDSELGYQPTRLPAAGLDNNPSLRVVYVLPRREAMLLAGREKAWIYEPMAGQLQSPAEKQPASR